MDAWHFEALLKQAPEQASREQSVRVLEKALNCWFGPLSGLSENSVTISYRERLNDQLAKAAIRLARLREDGGDADGAVSIYQRGLALDDTAEPLYQELMKLYHRMGKGAEAASVFRRCKQVLKTKAGMSPNPSTQALLDSFSFMDPDEPHRISKNLPTSRQRSFSR